MNVAQARRTSKALLQAATKLYEMSERYPALRINMRDVWTQAAGKLEREGEWMQLMIERGYWRDDTPSVIYPDAPVEKASS